MRICIGWSILALLLDTAEPAAAWIGCSSHTHNQHSSPRMGGQRLLSSSFLSSKKNEHYSLTSKIRFPHCLHGCDNDKDKVDGESLSNHHDDMENGEKSSPLTTTPPMSNRRMLLRDILTMGGLVVTTTTITSTSSCQAYTPDSDPLRESLYFISRVQEATVQQERFVRNTKLQEDLQKKMKLTLRLVEKNYRLLDQINYASQFVSPSEDIVTATEAGNLAVEALQGAIDFVKTDLRVGPLTPDQITFLTESMQETRTQLFVFLQYMPAQKLEEARFRVEDENVKNRDEFDGESNAGVYNPVILPWKQK